MDKHAQMRGGGARQVVLTAGQGHQAGGGQGVVHVWGRGQVWPCGKEHSGQVKKTWWGDTGHHEPR